MQQTLKASSHCIELGNERLPIVIRKRSNARRMVIRYQPVQHLVTLTLPRSVSIRQGLRFVEEKRGWIEKQIAGTPHRVPFQPGQVIPVLGQRYTLQHVGGRGVARIDGEHLLVPGDAAFMPRRVREWLKAKAKEEITKLAEHYAAQLGKKVRRVGMRDTVSRWGSCSQDGCLSFSWRLVFAPHETLDYVVCHEVAHLVEMNHSVAFWRLVAQLCPDYETHRRWLACHGQGLYLYGGASAADY